MNRRRLSGSGINLDTEFRKKRGIEVSIFDYFVSKPADEQPRKPLSPTPHRRIFSELEEARDDAKEQYPEDSEMMDDFVRVLKEAYQSRYKKKLGNEPQPLRAEPRFFLSEDRMSAYACLLPPENGGDGITLEAFLEDMHYEGINHGVLREDIQRELARGYFRIFPVARGTRPQDGIDGKVTELFQRRSNKCLEIRSDNQVDFNQDIQLQPIRKGTVICLIRSAKPGTDGMDVTGQKLPCPPPISVSAPRGENTSLSKGGQALTASVDGILYIKDDLFCVHAQKIIDGDLNQFQGTLQISGNLYIEGNVDGGVNVVASGDVVINGKVMQARVSSMSGTIRVQHGIYGTSGKTFLSAAGQVQAPVMEWAEISAGDSVIAEVISNSSIRCDGTVYVMNGRGTITGSSIQAGDSVLCVRVGNLAQERSRFSVGYPPRTPETWNRVKTELAEVQSTINMLWTTITDLRRKGGRITDREKTVLQQLVEQRDLYMKKREALSSELGMLEKVLEKKSKGRIQCEKLLPSLDVQFGRLTEEITTEEDNCSIHVVENRILLR